MIIKQQSLNITHLVFAGDIILFFQASQEGLFKLLGVLSNFCQA